MKMMSEEQLIDVILTLQEAVIILQERVNELETKSDDLSQRVMNYQVQSQREWGSNNG